MITKEINNLDLKEIAESGQAFRFKEEEDGHYSLVAFDHYLDLWQNGNSISFSCSEEDFENIYRGYFDLDTDYEAIGRGILAGSDSHLKEAYELGMGIRILRQDLWEMIVTFMISQNNNIKRIRKSVEEICKKAGLPTIEGKGYRFPKAGEIPPEFFLDKNLGLGYREQYLCGIYDFAEKNPEWLSELKECSYEEAMDKLLQIKGIGKKVANCICLFGLHHVDAFPIDTHVKQLLEKYYPEGFSYDLYKGYAGIIQQYLFYYEIKN